MNNLQSSTLIVFEDVKHAIGDLLYPTKYETLDSMIRYITLHLNSNVDVTLLAEWTYTRLHTATYSNYNQVINFFMNA